MKFIKQCGVLAASLLLATNVLASELKTWPEGGELVFPYDRIEVINFWASWCPPCRREMPEFSRWYDKHKNSKETPALAMVGIAFDKEENVAKFIKTTPVSYPLAIYSGRDGRHHMKTLGNESGGLPFTLVRAQDCDFEKAIPGEIGMKELDVALSEARAACKKRM